MCYSHRPVRLRNLEDQELPVTVVLKEPEDSQDEASLPEDRRDLSSVRYNECRRDRKDHLRR